MQFPDQLKKSEGINDDMKVQVPFPKLPSFILAAFVLGYVGDDIICVSMLQMLSKNCRRYCAKHIDILRDFLPAWYPRLSGEINFGSKALSMNHIYPTL